MARGRGASRDGARGRRARVQRGSPRGRAAARTRLGGRARTSRARSPAERDVRGGRRAVDEPSDGCCYYSADDSDGGCETDDDPAAARGRAGGRRRRPARGGGDRGCARARRTTRRRPAVARAERAAVARADARAVARADARADARRALVVVDTRAARGCAPRRTSDGKPRTDTLLWVCAAPGSGKVAGSDEKTTFFDVAHAALVALRERGCSPSSRARRCCSATSWTDLTAWSVEAGAAWNGPSCGRERARARRARGASSRPSRRITRGRARRRRARAAQRERRRRGRGRRRRRATPEPPVRSTLGCNQKCTRVQ